ncbi:hypothetical protein Bhyg_16845 [Pseudolycoriella hygida]|uniref:Uncharacterized protein n=1 Tax=Pseudolycoriella hygida TaxID=35572 RepID=A0A9Q0RVM4_9DIPT|nr:hypothetical protein Bhyg_16845 [Pseudolycoriella hygida]
MKSIFGIFVLLLASHKVTPSVLLQGGLEETLEVINESVGEETSNELNGLISKLSEELTRTLNDVVQPINKVTVELDTLTGSTVPVLTELTGVISHSFTKVILIVKDITSSLPIGVDLTTLIHNIPAGLIELVQCVNVLTEITSTLINQNEIIAIVNGIVASLSDVISNLLQDILACVSSIVADPITADSAKVILVVQLSLQTILKIVGNVFVAVERLLFKVTDFSSNILPTTISALKKALASVDKMVIDFSSDAKNAIKEVIPSLKATGDLLSLDVSKIVDSASTALALAVGNVFRIMGESSATTNVAYQDSGLKGTLSDVAAALYGIFSQMEAAVSSVGAHVQSVLGLVDKALTVVANNAGEILAIITSITVESCKDSGSDNGIADQLNNAVNLLVASVQGVVSSILSIANGTMSAKIAAILEHIVCAVITLVEFVVAAVAGLLEHIVASINNITDELPTIISGALHNILQAINGVKLDKVLNGLSKSVSALNNNLESSLSITLSIVAESTLGVSSSISGVLDGITGALCSVLNGTIGKISDVVKELNESVANGTAGPLPEIVVKDAPGLSLLVVNVNVILQTLMALQLVARNIGIY